MAFANIEKCGLYQDDLREWFRKMRLEKTWSNFKAHFARAFKETQISSRNSKTKGYAANVKSAQSNAELFTEMQQDHTMSLTNTETKTQANRTSVALLTKTITELSTQVTTLTAKLAAPQSENARIKISRYCSANAGAPSNNGHCLANVGAPADHNLPHDRNIYSRSGQKFNPNGYCSSQGFKVDENHTPTTCTRPLNNHNKLATQLDAKGGVQRNKTWVNSGPTE